MAMQTHTVISTPARHAGGQSRAAVRFFLLATLLCSLATGLCTLLVWLTPPRPEGTHLVFPPAFVASTLLLAAGSYAMQRAVRFVRREKQRDFRRWLKIACGIGVLFIAVQSYSLWWLTPAPRVAGEESTGVVAFVLVLASLHALHFAVATLFVAFVTVRAAENRYDHEYHWGVTFCAWFWHFLGIVWVAILAVIAIVL